ncbi:MAG: TonB-dependent receptor [Bacteroidales bacterium]|nr:TonB-dependent receptor [Bacteroidales bacterium]
MRQVNTLLTVFVFIIISVSLSAQQSRCKINGMVVTDKDVPISFASVYVQQNDSMITGGITDQDGKFELFVKQSEKTYSLSVVYVGCQAKHRDFFANTNEYNAGRIVLESSQLLDEVTVSAEDEEKSSTSVVHTTLRPADGTAFMSGSISDLLKSDPSLTIDQNGNVSIRGNSNVLILLDGVPIPLSSVGDLPSSNVASIDIVKNPNASYDAEGTGGIINIVTKKGLGKGFNGIIAVNYGFNHFTNGNVGFNLTREKVAFRFNYQVKYEDDVNRGYLHRYYHATGDSLSQNVNALRTTFNNNISLGVTVMPSKRDRLMADVRLILPRLNTIQDLTNDLYHNGLSNIEHRQSDVTWNRENINLIIAYTHSIRPNKLSFSIKGNVSKIWGHRPSYYFLEEDSVSKSVSGGSPLLAAIQNDWRIMKNWGIWDAGVKFSYRQNDIYHQFYELDSTGWSYSNDFSNDLLHREYVPAAYVQFAFTKWKQFHWNAGLRAEYSQVSLHSNKEALDETSHHFFLAPSLSFKYDINKKQSLSFAYSRRITRPSYPQLNPYMSMIDPHYFEQGNMNLKPETTDNVELLYQFKNSHWNISTALYANHTRNYITQVARYDGDILLMTYINATSQTKAGLDLSVTVDPWEWMSVQVATNTYYLRSVGNINDWDISNQGWVNNSNLRLNFKPIRGMSLIVQYFLNTPQYYPQFTTLLSHYMNISISQKFLKGRLTVSAMLTDVFNTRKWEIYSDNQYYRLENLLRNKSRMVWLGISYNFNSYKKTEPIKSNDEDRSKIKTGV